MQSKSQKTSSGPAPAAEEELLKEEIQREAHKLWLAGGCRHGEDLRHWLAAENAVLTGKRKS